MARLIEVNLIFKTPQMCPGISPLSPVASLIDVSIKPRCTAFSQSDVVERRRKLHAEIPNSSRKDGEFQRIPAPGSADLPNLPDRGGHGGVLPAQERTGCRGARGNYSRMSQLAPKVRQRDAPVASMKECQQSAV